MQVNENVRLFTYCNLNNVIIVRNIKVFLIIEMAFNDYQIIRY